MFTLNDSQNINLNESDLYTNSINFHDDYEFKNMLDSTLNKTLSNIIELVPNRLKDLDYLLNKKKFLLFIKSKEKETNSFDSKK